MLLAPALRIGLCNAWILAAIQFLAGLIVLINKEVRKKNLSTPKLTKKERSLRPAGSLYFVVLLYSIFVPLELGTLWFYSGLVVYFLGLVPLTISYFNYASTPVNEPAVKGIYRISRHPQYFFSVIALIGAGIASASWVIILLLVVYQSLLPYFIVSAEERSCLEEYGDVYQQYMNRTPRWIGIPSSRKG